MPIIFSYLPLKAISDVPVSDTEHKRIMTQFISELKSIQNRILGASQLALDEPPENISLTRDINLINNDISKLRQRVIEYNSDIPSTDLRNKDALFLRNAINDSQISLYQLSEISQTTTNLEKILLLEDFFEYKKSGEQTLVNLENMITRY
jgi:hypothetical protein